MVARHLEVLGTAYEPPALVVPVGKPIRFRITSRDVVHSFYAPAFLTKRDALPGREKRIDLTIDRPRSRSVVVDAWIAQQLDGHKASPSAP